MDLAYFLAHPEHITAFLTHQRIRETPVTGGSICSAQRLTFDDGASVFAKTLPQAPTGFFTAESQGLQWLSETRTVSAPAVIATLPDMLILEWLERSEPTPFAAERFGRELAELHRHGAAEFGAPWPGFIGTLPLDNTLDSGDWPEWFAQRRLEPYLRLSVNNGALSRSDLADIDKVLSRITELAGAAGHEPPARLHGDLWPGNLLWSTDRVWIVDPAAHAGHRETDLALLRLFGAAAFLERIIDAYHEVWPLADGWKERIPLHQLYLLLVHTALFGRGYRNSVMKAVRALT